VKSIIIFSICVTFLGGACGKDKVGSADEAGPTAGPPCAEAAAAYVKLKAESGGNEVYALEATPAELAVVTSRLEANCNAGWTAESKACVVALKNTLKDTLGNRCFKGLEVPLVVERAVNEVKAARAAASAAAGAAPTPDPVAAPTP